MSADERRAIGARVREARSARGISQRELADAVGVDPSMISRVERGERELSGLQLSGAAEVLGLSVGQLALPMGMRSPGTTERAEAPDLEHEAWGLLNLVRGVVQVGGALNLVAPIAFIKLASDLSPPDPVDPFIVIAGGARWQAVCEQVSERPFDAIAHAWELLERDNPSLRGAFDYTGALGKLPQHLLGELIERIGQFEFGGPDHSLAQGALEFQRLIDGLATAQGARGGDVFTPASVVALVVALTADGAQTVFDPACGTGSLLIAACVAANETTAATGFGQEINDSVGRVAILNMVAHRVSGEARFGDSLREDAWPNLSADLVIANPPFGQRSWGAADTVADPRWRHGLPPEQDATFAWIQHGLSHLAPEGKAAFVLPISSLWAEQRQLFSIRQSLIDAGEVAAVISCPPRLLPNTGIPICVWLVDRELRARQARREVLLIDASHLGRLRGKRGQTALADDEIAMIVDAYSRWATDKHELRDIGGFAASVPVERLAENGYVLTPARYISATETTPGGEPPTERLRRLERELATEGAEIARLQTRVIEILSEALR